MRADVRNLHRAFGFIASTVTTVRFSQAALAITKGSATLPPLLLLDVLLKVRHRIDLYDERAFLCRWRREKLTIALCPACKLSIELSSISRSTSRVDTHARLVDDRLRSGNGGLS